MKSMSCVSDDFCLFYNLSTMNHNHKHFLCFIIYSTFPNFLNQLPFIFLFQIKFYYDSITLLFYNLILLVIIYLEAQWVCIRYFFFILKQVCLTDGYFHASFHFLSGFLFLILTFVPTMQDMFSVMTNYQHDSSYFLSLFGVQYVV